MIVPPIGGLGGGSATGQRRSARAGRRQRRAAPARPALARRRAKPARPAAHAQLRRRARPKRSPRWRRASRARDSASQALATGTVKDPESAVVTVEDAQLAMELAAQIRTKATEAAQTIFQTQV